MHEHPLVADEGPRTDVRFKKGPQILSIQDVPSVEDPVAVRPDFLILVAKQWGQESDCLRRVILVAGQIGQCYARSWESSRIFSRRDRKQETNSDPVGFAKANRLASDRPSASDAQRSTCRGARTSLV